jgi:hypothetical protein
VLAVIAHKGAGRRGQAASGNPRRVCLHISQPSTILVPAGPSYYDAARCRAFQLLLPENDMPSENPADTAHAWPALPFADWKDTRATLHMWTQIVGKMRLALTPWTNHSWHVPLYVTARGLTTSPIAYEARVFEIDFDFVEHLLWISTSDGQTRTVELKPRTVADFYRELFNKLGDLGLQVRIHTRPNEVENAIPFDQDQAHAAYDPVYANRFWRVLLQADRLFKQFRSGFIGKASPIHFFWGSFDLAVTRFSGAEAPQHPGGVTNCPDWITREAYSHEVSSCGFWPGNEAMPMPLFYSYAYPTPAGFGAVPVRPSEARFEAALGEFVLPYDAVRQAQSPDAMVLDFLQDTYEAAAGLAGWNRRALERTAD